MNFKMNKLATAVAVTLGTSAVVVGTVQADEILFPYVVSSQTVATILSVINNADINFDGTAPSNLHYRYYYKSGSNAANNTASCQEVNRSLPSSANDIVTFDAAGQFANDNLGILFENTKRSVLPSAGNQGYGKSSFALLKGVTQPVRAFLIVDNNDFTGGAAGFGTRETLAGEAIVLEFVNGAAWGYQAYNAAGRYITDGAGNLLRTNAYDFSDFSETAGEVIAGQSNLGYAPVAIAPFNATGGELLTKFFVTPISPTTQKNGVWVSGNQLNNRLNARLQLAIQDLGLGATGVMYDRDEVPISGQALQNVVCVGAVDASTLLSEGALLQVADGGWSNITVKEGTTSGAVSTPEAIVIKLEYNTEKPLQLDGDKESPAIREIINNAIWLRRGIKESIPRFDENGNSIPLTLSALGNDINAQPGVVVSTSD